MVFLPKCYSKIEKLDILSCVVCEENVNFVSLC